MNIFSKHVLEHVRLCLAGSSYGEKQWDILLEIVRRFICWSHSRLVYGRVQMMALTPVYAAGLAQGYNL